MNVIIRPWEPGDAPGLSAVANNINVWNTLRDRFPHPYTLTAAEEWIAMCIKDDYPKHFVVVSDGVICGSIGFIPGTDVEKLSAEVGYFIGEQYWGKGLASTAVALMLQHLTAHHSFVRIFSVVFANNPASMKVLQKNGFSLEQVRKRSVFKNGIIMDDYVWVHLLR